MPLVALGEAVTYVLFGGGLIDPGEHRRLVVGDASWVKPRVSFCAVKLPHHLPHDLAL